MPTLVRAPNRASDADVVEAVEKILAPLIKRVREDKQTLNATSLRYWNIWAARHDSNAYNGRTRAYLTTGRRVIENWVAMLKRMAFPVSGRWFEVQAKTIPSEDRAEVVQALLQEYLTRYVNLRRKSSPLLRGLVILGTQPIDQGWKLDARDVPTVEEIVAMAGSDKPARLQETVKRVVDYLGPTIRPVDFFRWYMWPTTVNDLTDAELCFEDFLQDPRELAVLAKKPILPGNKDLGFHIDPKAWKRAEELLPRGDGAGDKWQEQRSRLQARGFHAPMTQGDKAPTMDCIKGYWHTMFRGDDAPKWYEVVIAGDDIALRVREVSKLSGQPSYHTPKFVEVLEEFYGYGLPAAFDSAHYLLNDIFNQGADALTWSLNPIAGVDPDAIQDHTSLKMKPGAKWLVRLPRQSIAWMEPPKESGVVALQSVQQLVGLINDVGGVQPFAPGGQTQGKGRSINTLGGLQMLASEGQLQASDVVQAMEDLWLNPMLRRMYDDSMQLLDEPLMLNVTGVGGAALVQTRVTRSTLIGEFDFRWLASVYQYNAEVRSQQMLGFLQVVSRIPPEILAADNTKVRVGEFLRMIYSDGLMLPHANRIFQDIEPVRAVDARIENDLFQQGHGESVTVSPADNDDQHIALHGQLAMRPDLDPMLRAQVLGHVQQHQIAKVAKAMMQAQQQGMIPGPGAPGMGMGGGMPGGGPPGAPGAPSPMGGGNGSDRLAMPDAPGRMAGTTSMDDLARRMPRPGGQGPGGMPQ